MQSLILQALAGKEIERPPVWIMRQAGRYMPEYRALKERYTFLELCRQAELAVEVTMQPINFLNPDAAIIFSDILVPFEPMGIEIDFNPGPVIKTPVCSPSDVSALKEVNPEQDLSFVLQAISEVKEKLLSLPDNKALLGFAGAPWTLACYILERGIFKHFENGMVFAMQHPEAMHQLLSKLSTVVSDYLIAQHQAGADAVQLFDSWGGNLSAADYEIYSLPYIKNIISNVQKAGCPIILYVGNNSHLLPLLKDSGADCISIDWRTTLSTAEKILGGDITIQGNLNPTHLYGTEQEVRERTRAMLKTLKRRNQFIANLGHGILPTTPPENAKAYVETIREGWLNQ
jgi:uroporphyrinogen decarboxylase